MFRSVNEGWRVWMGFFTLPFIIFTKNTLVIRFRPIDLFPFGATVPMYPWHIIMHYLLWHRTEINVALRSIPALYKQSFVRILRSRRAKGQRAGDRSTYLSVFVTTNDLKIFFVCVSRKFTSRRHLVRPSACRLLLLSYSQQIGVGCQLLARVMAFLVRDDRGIYHGAQREPGPRMKSQSFSFFSTYFSRRETKGAINMMLNTLI